MSELSIWEIAESAKINFENVVKMNPALGQHPIFKIAMEQLKEVIEMLEKQQKDKTDICPICGDEKPIDDLHRNCGK